MVRAGNTFILIGLNRFDNSSHAARRDRLTADRYLHNSRPNALGDDSTVNYHSVNCHLDGLTEADFDLRELDDPDSRIVNANRDGVLRVVPLDGIAKAVDLVQVGRSLIVIDDITVLAESTEDSLWCGCFPTSRR